MKVQQISYKNNNSINSLGKLNNTQSIRSNVTNTANDSYTPAFAGLEKALIIASKRDMATEPEVSKIFHNLFKVITEEKNITVSDDYTLLTKIFEQKGFYGLFRTLSLVDLKNVDVENMMKKAKSIPIICLDDIKLMTVNNLSKRSLFFGLFNSANKASKNRSISISFTDNINSISFAIRKNGNIKVVQNTPSSNCVTEFYAATGHRKKSVYKSKDFNNTVYYHRDGSVNKLKSLFLGFSFPKFN